MVKLLINLDPKDPRQMRALESFAGILAGAETLEPVDKPKAEEPKPEEPKPEEPKPEEPKPEEPKKRTRRAKPEEPKTEEPKVDEPAKTSKITLDDIRRVVAEKKEKHFEIMKFKLKEDFGVSKTPDLSEDQYEAFFNFVNGL